MSDSVLVHTENGVARIQLNRPERLNALDPRMATSLRSIITDISQKKDIRSVCLSGSGPAFMAGGDLSYFNQIQPQLTRGDHSSLDPVFRDIHQTVTTMRTMPQPIVAGVHGAVAGFGLSLMMACDLVMAAEGSVFTLAYCGIGVSPDGGATYALPRIVGTKRAMELALLGQRFDSARALELGLVNWVVADDELEDQCNTLGQRLAQGPKLAYAHTKSLINSSQDLDLDAQLETERECFFDCAATDDFVEGIAAFLEKRKPRFDQ